MYKPPETKRSYNQNQTIVKIMKLDHQSIGILHVTLSNNIFQTRNVSVGARMTRQPIFSEMG